MFLNLSCNMSNNVVNFKSLDGKEFFMIGKFLFSKTTK